RLGRRRYVVDKHIETIQYRIGIRILGLQRLFAITTPKGEIDIELAGAAVVCRRYCGRVKEFALRSRRRRNKRRRPARRGQRRRLGKTKADPVDVAARISDVAKIGN